MSNRFVRRVFVGLIFVFPLLIGAVSSRSLTRFVRGIHATSPVMAVEILMAGGVVFAGRERRRLLEAQTALAGSRAEWGVARPSAALAGPKAVTKAKRHVFGASRR